MQSQLRTIALALCLIAVTRAQSCGSGEQNCAGVCIGNSLVCCGPDGQGGADFCQHGYSCKPNQQCEKNSDSNHVTTWIATVVTILVIIAICCGLYRCCRRHADAPRRNDYHAVHHRAHTPAAAPRTAATCVPVTGVVVNDEPAPEPAQPAYDASVYGATGEARTGYTSV